MTKGLAAAAREHEEARVTNATRRQGRKSLTTLPPPLLFLISVSPFSSPLTRIQSGGHGSIGYRTVFEKKEATKNLLRTHTTAISAQMLYKLANQPGGFTPKKYFSIDRVFRNESMDKTHLCEFHQVKSLAFFSFDEGLRRQPKTPSATSPHGRVLVKA